MEAGLRKKVLWLATRDLRLLDNPALSKAALSGDILCLFVMDKNLIDSAKIGLNRLTFLSESLTDLRRQLRATDSELFVRYGNYESEVLAFAKSAGIDEVHITIDYSGYAKARNAKLQSLLQAENIVLVTHPGGAVIEPGVIRPHEGNFYKVFTPYYKNWEPWPRRALPALPAELTGHYDGEPGRILSTEEVTALLAEAILHRASFRNGTLGKERGKFLLHLSPYRALGGEEKARERLAHFIDSGNIFSYAGASNDLESDSTSRISPYLHFGCISPLSVEQAVLTAYSATYAEGDQNSSVAAGNSIDGEQAAASVQAFVRQLCWRDFYLQFADGFSQLATANYRERPYEWNTDTDALISWMNGETGQDIVDAAMLQLQEEGFVHNRARLIASSYLSKTLKIDWRHGLNHYDSLLSDADFSSNAGNWQWMAGTGTDTRPNRVLSPKRQAERFDPNGSYRKRYLSESRSSIQSPGEQRLF